MMQRNQVNGVRVITMMAMEMVTIMMSMPIMVFQGGGGGLQQGFSMPVTVPVNPSSVYSDPGEGHG